MSEQQQNAVIDGMLSVLEAVQFTRLSRAELYNAMGRGELPYAKHGRRRLVPKRALMAMLASKLVGAGEAVAAAG